MKWIVVLLIVMGWGVEGRGAPSTGASGMGAATMGATTEGVGAGDLRVTITGVVGLVQARVDENSPWQMAQVGMVLDAGAEFRTGPHSSVRMTIPPDQTITLDRLGIVKVMDAIRTSTGVKTDLGMKYGRTRYDIEAEGLAHDSTIHTPNSTLAVRGTQVTMYDQPPFDVEATSLRGKAWFVDSNGDEVTFGGKRQESIGFNQSSAAETSLLKTGDDAGWQLAKTPEEEGLVNRLPSLGGNGLGNGLIDRPVSGPGPLANPGDLPKGILSSGGGGGFLLSPGTLDFNLTWRGDANLDLAVISPLGELLVSNPAADVLGGMVGKTKVGSGGRIDFDRTSHGGAGSETAEWKNSYPGGTFIFGARYVSGSTPATFTITTTLNGRAVGGGFVDTLDTTLGVGSFSGSQVNVKSNKK